jgi:membrane-associated protease RseP (regulator of RpoE activity)
MKINTKTILLLASVAIAPLMASESFGGIGVSIYQSYDGVKIAEIIPGTPAAESNMRAGDVIVAVDGESLKGKTIEESKAKLRGQKNKPLEVIYVSKGDTLSTILRRTQITVKDLESERVESWYGDKSEYSAQELETFASATENSKQLVAVMQNGSVVKSDASVSAKSLNGIYVDQVDEFAPKVKSQSASKPSSAKLKMLTRTTVAFELKSAGRTVVSIMDPDGAVIAKLVNENARAGYNSLNWNSGNVPSGRYTVTIEHNGSISGKNVLLK